MSSVQVYETTVTDGEGNWIARIAVFPQRAFHEQQVPTDETSLRAFFGFTEFHQLETASVLPRVLASLLTQDEVEQQFAYPPSGAPSILSLPPPSVVEPALFEFAEELSFTEIVPFESSPLSLQSLASIALKAAQGGATPLGAVTAFVAVGPTPLLLVAVPLGIVLCGGAVAFGKWLDQHREELFTKILRVTSRRRQRPRRAMKLSDEPEKT